MPQPEVAALIERLALRPHPEGGWFREVYRSAEAIPALGLPERFDAERRVATSIYFLLDDGDFSALHRIRADEQWHFYAGTGVTVHVIHPDGRYRPLCLGRDLAAGELFQGVVPHGCWFGASVEEPGGYALVGCSVAPGFEFADFELGERAALLAAFPQHAELVIRLTRR